MYFSSLILREEKSEGEEENVGWEEESNGCGVVGGPTGVKGGTGWSRGRKFSHHLTPVPQTRRTTDYQVAHKIGYRHFFSHKWGKGVLESVQIAGCSRLMANGDYWGLMGIYFHPINLNGDYWGLMGVNGD